MTQVLLLPPRGLVETLPLTSLLSCATLAARPGNWDPADRRGSRRGRTQYGSVGRTTFTLQERSLLRASRVCTPGLVSTATLPSVIRGGYNGNTNNNNNTNTNTNTNNNSSSSSSRCSSSSSNNNNNHNHNHNHNHNNNQHCHSRTSRCTTMLDAPKHSDTTSSIFTLPSNCSLLCPRPRSRHDSEQIRAAVRLCYRAHLSCTSVSKLALLHLSTGISTRQRCFAEIHA